MAKSGSWRKKFAKTEVLQRVRPVATFEYLNNPHKGTTTFQRFNGDPLYPDMNWDDTHGPEKFPPPVNKDLSNGGSPSTHCYMPTRMSYCRWIWGLLEPKKKGEIHFDWIEKALETAAKRGQSLQIRTQPFIGNDTPAWYWNTGAKHDEAALAGANVKCPNHNDPLYLKHWGDHLRALAKRFDGHPNLESFDVAYGGACGECGGNTSPKTAEKLVDVYMSAFKKTPLVFMQGTDGLKYAMSINGKGGRWFGWRADCYGDLRTGAGNVVPKGLCWNHMYDLYPREAADYGTGELWKHGPITLETCWTVAYWEDKGWDIDWILEHGLKYRPSVFMPKSVWIPAKWMDKFYAWNNRIGYWFFVHQIILPLESAPGQKFKVPVTIDNKGVAPIYRPYRFAVRFSQGKNHYVVPFKQDIRTWMPDYTSFTEDLTVPKALKKGAAQMSCAIIDDNDKPVVRLAIKDLGKDGWHGLAPVEIV